MVHFVLLKLKDKHDIAGFVPSLRIVAGSTVSNQCAADERPIKGRLLPLDAGCVRLDLVLQIIDRNTGEEKDYRAPSPDRN